jgi:hypothetical protein
VQFTQMGRGALLGYPAVRTLPNRR